MDLAYQLSTSIGKLTADLQDYSTGDVSNTELLRKGLASANLALSTGKDLAQVTPLLLQALGTMPTNHPCRDRLFRIHAALMAIRAAETAVIVAGQQ